MDFTESQLENIADHLRSVGFTIDDLCNDDIALFTNAILEALNTSEDIEFLQVLD